MPERNRTIRRASNAVITLDCNGLLNGQIGQASLKLPPTPRDCDLSSAQAEVFTGLVNPGGFTSGASLGFCHGQCWFT